MNRLILFLLLCSAMIPRETQAQQKREQLQRAQTYSWFVRASRGDSVVASGRVRALTSDKVRIDTTNILFSDLTTLERRMKVGGGWRQGAIAGSVVMGGLGVLFAAAWCGDTDSGGGGCNPLTFLGSAALGVTIGFPIGGMIGSAVRPGDYEWQPIWPTAGN